MTVGTVDRKKDGAKWNILGLVNMGINTFINLFSFFGYIGLVGYISPLSIIIYVIVLGLLTIYYPRKKEKNSDENRELWDKYYLMAIYSLYFQHKSFKILFDTYNFKNYNNFNNLI